MADKKPSLGQAIDAIIEALEPLDAQARQTAINAAYSHLGLKTPISNNLIASPHLGDPVEPIRKPKGVQVDIRSFKEEKNPKSASQMACVVAYYLQELAPDAEKKDAVTAADLTKYFKQAGFRLPQTISQLLPDTRAAGYFNSGPGKGEYTLNAVGYNLVAHNLPAKPGK